MKALVTGGTGFVGHHLIDALLKRGDDVTALVRSPAKAAPLKDRGVRLVTGDLDAMPAMREAAAGAEVIYHLAGLVAARDDQEFLHANRDGTANLLAAAAAVGSPRFVLVSSLAAAGPSARGVPLTGHEPPRPVTPYGRSKLAGEEVVRASPLPWVILRPPIVYGPRDTEVFKLFRLARWGLGAVFGKGDQQLSAVYGPDLAEALVAAGTSPKTISRTYFPAHPEVFTSASLARQVGTALGRRVVLLPIPELVGRGLLAAIGGMAKLTGAASVLSSEKAPEFFEPAWTVDPSALTADTGWSARTPLALGLAEAATWYRAERWL
ncbi:MAG TPA: NAD-dependent epimerase/dehydratase family protein [Gemmatimonadales bacterium]|nr:NAD-dependent epimerase/dehydratase family protein [Gemmatimonadales bacterium]